MKLFIKYRWHIAQAAAVVVAFLAFFIWAPWLAAVPLDEVPTSVAATLPANCPAAAVNHGTWSCRWHGTVKSNPWGFALCTVIFLGAVAFLNISSWTGRGFHKKRRK